MSLIPYPAGESREIVLRHNDAIVVRDPRTQQLILYAAGSFDSLPSCPACHRPYQGASPEHQEPPHGTAPFISPEYFRMLQSVNGSTIASNPPNQARRLVEPAIEFSVHGTGSSTSGAESSTGLPDIKTGYSINKEAFSQNYFKKFFIEEKELGRGGKGVVLLVRHELDNVSLGQFACKRVPVGDDHAWLEKVLVEVQLLQGLSHPNLVSYRHVWLEDVKVSRFAPSVPCAFILQQYCNSGDLLHYIVGATPQVKSAKEQIKEQRRRRSQSQTQSDFRIHQRRLAFEEIFSIFKDITSGLAHLHASNYIHRDLKPSNCLLHLDGNEMRCLISDFGEVQAENVVRKSTGSTGTISYCAPEVLKQDSSGRYGNFTTKSDVFSLGMILYFMCFGRLPYKSADSIQEEFEDITLLRAEISAWSGFCDERRERPDLPIQLYDFLKILLAIDPAERPSAGDILTALRTEKGLGNPRSKNSNAKFGTLLLQSLESTKRTGNSVNSVNDPIKRAAPHFQDTSTSEPQSSESVSHSQLLIQAPTARSQVEVQQPSSILGSRNPVRGRQLSPVLSPKNATPLLMPPPSTPFSMFLNTITLYKHHIHAWMRRNRQAPDLSIRIIIYMIKMWSLTTPCSPRVVRASLWWPLMTLAATELAFGGSTKWNLLIAVTVAHIAALWMAALWYDGVAEGICGWQTDLWN
ncbi:hypothetical protein K3495_g11491 [Podosphaera aphanis]|nr:hypothetical protein K3495_g11491 [Podosphaera aphanis]